MIFFDIDATLLDHEQAERLGALDLYKLHKNSLSMNESDFIEQWHTYSERYFQKFVDQEISFFDQRRMRIRELFGHSLSDGECDLKFEDYLLFYRNNWKVFSDVIPCLEGLKKIGSSLGIISNGKYSQQIKKLKEVGIIEYFDVIVTSSEVGFAKPNQKIFFEACKRANVQVNYSYYVGDQLETDAIGSTKAGMKGIWLNRKDKTTLPDIHTINSLHQLKTII